MEIYFINIVKTVAAFLITNSHFDDLYPNPIFSTGGAIGNVLFCLVSGFCLSKAVYKTFPKWIWSRVARLYPTLWLGSIVWAIYNNVSFSWGVLLEITFLPMKFLQFYWFIPAICCFYIFIYFVANYFQKHLGKVLIFLMVLYFVIYTTMLDKSMWIVEIDLRIKYVLYFMIMCLGYWLKQNWKKTYKIVKSTHKSIYGLLVVSMVLFLGSKLLINKILNFQFVVQIATALVGLMLFLICATLEEQLKRYDKTQPCIRAISASTLEIYLMNFIVVGYSKTLTFPVNVLVAFVFIFISGIAMHYIAEKIAKCFTIIDKMWRI